jgi:2-amino-4-hydroxy-6-hydroxymethyldihydropteridine diphosphokinase
MDNLTVPHPRLHERKFTMIPLAEVAADFLHPVFVKTNMELLQLLADTSQVWKYSVE